MLDFPFARPFFRLQYFLHGFKQCGSYNWLKVSIKPFITMFDETEICPMSKKSFDGNLESVPKPYPGHNRLTIMLIMANLTMVSDVLVRHS